MAWEKLPRDPFEYSPYLEQLALTEKPPPADPNASGPEDVVRKPTQALPAEYTASVEIEEGLVAVIGRDMVRVNDLYNGKKVTKIENNLVFLEDESALYIMPKTGVRLDVASDGTYSISDEFYKHRNLH